MPTQDDWYYNSGKRDAERGRGPLFRNVQGTWEPTVDDPMSDDWEPWKREAYMQGYDVGANGHM
jgi:hypothetical protein